MNSTITACCKCPQTWLLPFNGVQGLRLRASHMHNSSHRAAVKIKWGWQGGTRLSVIRAFGDRRDDGGKVEASLVYTSWVSGHHLTSLTASLALPKILPSMQCSTTGLSPWYGWTCMKAFPFVCPWCIYLRISWLHTSDHSTLRLCVKETEQNQITTFYIERLNLNLLIKNSNQWKNDQTE